MNACNSIGRERTIGSERACTVVTTNKSSTRSPVVGVNVLKEVSEFKEVCGFTRRLGRSDFKHEKLARVLREGIGTGITYAATVKTVDEQVRTAMT